MSVLDPERIRRARRLRVFRRVLGVVELVVVLATMLLLYASGATASLRDAVSERGALTVYLVVAAVIVVEWLVTAPFAYVSHRRERAEGLSVQTLRGVAVDRVKGLAIELVLMGAAATVWYLLAGLALWWLVAVAGGLVVVLAGTLLGPALLGVFYRLVPLDDEAFAARIRELGARAGVRVAGVYRWDLSAKSTTGNAAVIGTGPTKRVIVADTMLREYTPAEIEAVAAHELAHVVRRDDIVGALVYGAAFSLTLLVLHVAIDGLTTGRAADVATFPLLVVGVMVLSFVGAPLLLWYSRSRESAADAFAVRFVPAPALASALTRLSVQNLGDPDPPRWETLLFLSHPPLRARLAALGQELRV